MTTETKTRLTFTIYGRPQQVGSKSPWNPTRADGSMVMKNGKPVIATMDSNKKSKPWMAAVAAAAGEVMEGRDLITGPVRLSVTFFFARPKAHYGTGRNAGKLKASAPERHAQTPDLAKLIRCLEDGMTKVVWRDDKQVCCYGEPSRQWTTAQERAEVVIDEV